MRPLLGDLLAAASEHLGVATSDVPQLPADATRTLVMELGRLTAVMARCAEAFVTEGGDDPAHLDAHALAVLDAQSGLRHAAARMHTAAGALGNVSHDVRHPAATHLASSTANLSAGHDLLQSHFTPGLSGTRHGNSLWAPAIVSAPVNAALTTTMGGYAGRLAPWLLRLAAAPSSKALPTSTRVAINAACRWLRIAEAAAWPVNCQPGTAADQALLRAIPVNVAPPRNSPRGDEPIPDLCAGTSATAERLRHLAHVPAGRTGTARTGLAAAWHRTAQGASITGHCTELILHQLAESAAQFPIPVTASAALKEAAHEIRGVWVAWRAVAHQWDTFTTGPGATLTPIAATIGDLTLWVGRLTHTDPAWTAARNNTSPARTSTGFANGGGTTTFAALRAIAPLTAYTPDSPAILSGRSTLGSRPGWLEQDLRRRGINEPTLLARAADIDDATQDLLNGALAPSQRRAAANRAALQPLGHPPTGRRHPARLAAEGVPPYTSSKTPLPRLVPVSHPIRHQSAPRHQPNP